MADHDKDPQPAAAVTGPTVDVATLRQPFGLHERCVIKKVLEAGHTILGATIVVGGWVRTGRTANAGAMAFIALSDGSTPETLQCVIENQPDLKTLTSTGASLLMRGEVKQNQVRPDEIEVHATEILHFGDSPAETYPIPKGKQGVKLETLRETIHMRIRTKTISAVTRVRNSLAAATHRFFQDQGFIYLHTPIITASDCEGAGEMFQVTTLLSDAESPKQPQPTTAELEVAEAALATAETRLIALNEKEGKKDKRKIKTATVDVQEQRASLEELKDRAASVGGLARSHVTGAIDFKKDFFGKAAFLTVSGQLEAEIYACAMTSVYTFGPTFRAENSHTTRHLAEFWMIEPEIAFCDLQGDMACAQAYVQYCCRAVLAECRLDLTFLQELFDKTLMDRLEKVAVTPFERVSYTEAIDILKAHVADSTAQFQDTNIFWGLDLGSEHERYLCESVFKGPIILYNYPKEIKSFYMRLNDDGKTVAAMDVLVPGIGELVGGSQREERLEKLSARITESGLDAQAYSWYLDLRRYGTVPHSGFGLGFERLVLFTTGMENIRDVIPFPRWPQHVL